MNWACLCYVLYRFIIIAFVWKYPKASALSLRQSLLLMFVSVQLQSPTDVQFCCLCGRSCVSIVISSKQYHVSFPQPCFAWTQATTLLNPVLSCNLLLCSHTLNDMQKEPQQPLQKPRRIQGCTAEICLMTPGSGLLTVSACCL